MESVMKSMAAIAALLTLCGCPPEATLDLLHARGGDSGRGGHGRGSDEVPDGEHGEDGDEATAAATTVALSENALSIRQLDFVEGGGLSAWGALTIDPTVAAREAGVAAGFVSVRTGLGWVVHNLPLQSRPADDWPDRVRRRALPSPGFVPLVTTHFNLGSTRAIESLELVAVFSSEPLNRRQALQQWGAARLSPFDVTQVKHTEPSGIAAPPPDGLPPGPPPAPPVLAPEPIEPELGVQNWYTVSQPAQDNVNSAFNQCAPVAYANALAYLDSTFGLEVPHPNIRGLAGGPGLVGVLDVMSARSSTDECNGNATGYCLDVSSSGFINALYDYLHTYDLDGEVTLDHQGVGSDYPEACGQSIPQQGPVSASFGPQVTVDWIRDHLENGDAVVMAFSRLAQTQNGEVVTSAHILRVYGYSEISGQDYLMTLDDQQQDAMNGNFCQQRDGGLTWESFAVGDSDNDGTLNKGLNNLREITFAMAIAAN